LKNPLSLWERVRERDLMYTCQSLLEFEKHIIPDHLSLALSSPVRKLFCFFEVLTHNRSISSFRAV